MNAAMVQRVSMTGVVLALMLAAALVPTLSRGLAGKQDSLEPWAEGCRTVARSTPGALPEPADPYHWQTFFEHCPQCGLDLEPTAWVPGATLGLPLLAPVDDGPQTWYVQPPPSGQARPTGQARAPPLNS